MDAIVIDGAARTMKAVRIHEYGAASVLRLEEAPVPDIAADEVLVEVHAAGINPADWQFRYGYYKDFAPRPMPFILGWDVAGVVKSTGARVERWKAGDRVFAMADMSRNGAYAEFIAVRAEHLAPAPTALPLEHAAGVPLAALTAWKALFDVGQLQTGQSVLVHAAAGGVGLFAVQLAKRAGARVVATASSANSALVGSLGVDQIIDYRAVDFSQQLANVDLVIDTVGGETRARSWGVLRKSGTLVAVAMPPPDPDIALEHGVRAAMTQVRPDGQRLTEIGRLIDAGELRVLIDSEFPLEQAAAAHERSESRHAQGKIILRVPRQ
jgi:NADPH:quinone reductase-like Zn-dependent oxidoreductase